MSQENKELEDILRNTEKGKVFGLHTRTETEKSNGYPWYLI